ncbi:MAG: hypothetical protein M5U28_07005 [Sandaracinaceae bacterium]|nr:hypothetical protein [Sandaracinaceae bacterium]
MHDPFGARLSLFTGKGGVGKSTLVAALAVEAARRGLSPLVVELGHRASMQAVFGAPEVGHAPALVAPGVHATNVDLDRTLLDYVAAHVRVRAIARRIGASASLRRFFEAAPAVAEVLTLWRIERLLAEERPGGAPRFSHLLVDLDATGHALMFLELPRVFAGLADSGPIAALLDSFTALLSDRATTRLHVVTLPGRLPVTETIELVRRLEAEHEVPLGSVFVNRVRAAPLSPEAEPVLAGLRGREPHAALREDLGLLEAALAAHRARRRELARLEALPLSRVELPWLRGPIDARALEVLGRVAAGAA